MYRNKAFTLIELLVVIAIIGILASVVIASVNSARDKARIGGGKHFAAQVDHIAGDQAAATWEFDECTGINAVDRSGNGNDAVLSSGAFFSPTTLTGSGCSVSFDGSDDYVNIATPLIPDSTTYTVMAWVKSNTIAVEQMIASKFYLQTTYKGWYAEIYQSKLNVGINGNAQVQALSALSSNTWYHLAFTYDGTTMKLYVDGILNRTATNASGITNPTGAMYIGRHTNGGGYIFNGFIDSVHVFTKDLTASEIGELYAEGLKTHQLAGK